MNRLDRWSTHDTRGDAAPLGSPKKTKKPIGPLALPMPSESARVESLEDGSLRILDALSREGLGRFLVQTADLVRDGLLETPAWFGVALGDGSSVRFDLGQGGDAPSRLAEAMKHMGARVLDGSLDPVSAAFSLECGCGVRVERRPGDRDRPSSRAPQVISP